MKIKIIILIWVVDMKDQPYWMSLLLLMLINYY